MNVPSLTTIDGMYDYLMGLLLAIALVIAVYLVAVYVGVAPDYSDIVPGVVGSVPPRPQGIAPIASSIALVSSPVTASE